MVPRVFRTPTALHLRPAPHLGVTEGSLAGIDRCPRKPPAQRPVAHGARWLSQEDFRVGIVVQTKGRYRMRHPALWLMNLASAAAPAAAQISAGGSVRGTIRDAQGGVLPGVTVTATSPSASRPVVALTDAQGYYRLTDLQPGSYVLAAELSGFTKYERRGIDIRAAMNFEIDIALQVGALTETVQVTAETPMLEVEKPSRRSTSAVISSGQLPLLPKRDWSSYLEVTPSVTSLDNGGGYSQVYMVRGGEMEGHVFHVDGTDIGGFRQARRMPSRSVRRRSRTCR